MEQVCVTPPLLHIFILLTPTSASPVLYLQCMTVNVSSNRLFALLRLTVWCFHVTFISENVPEGVTKVCNDSWCSADWVLFSQSDKLPGDEAEKSLFTAKSVISWYQLYGFNSHYCSSPKHKSVSYQIRSETLWPTKLYCCNLNTTDQEMLGLILPVFGQRP